MAGKRNGEGQTGQSEQKLTILEMVRGALQALGRDTKPAQLHPYIKEHFGRDIRPDLITKYKRDVFQQDQQRRKGKKKAAKRQTTPTSQEQTSQESVPAKESNAGGGQESAIPLQDVLYVKQLLGQVGSEQLHTLIDAFAK